MAGRALNGGLPLTYGYRCNTTQLQALEKVDVIRNSRCPTRDQWMQIALSHSLSVSAPTVVVVGCNKGDDFVALMEGWSGNASYDVRSHVERLAKFIPHTIFPCGAAKSMMSFAPKLPKPRPVLGFCLEPMPTNFRLLATISADMHFDRRYVHYLPWAVDMYPGVAMFADGEPGKEDLALDYSANVSAGNAYQRPVNVTNIDSFTAMHGITSIDFLSIDTEGFDGRVIYGAMRTLAAHKIRVFEFEYHRFGPWGSMDLCVVVDLLDMLGYDCFWQGHFEQLWRLTGCWLPYYAARRNWSNVVCVNRAETAMHAEFVALSERYAPFVN